MIARRRAPLTPARFVLVVAGVALVALAAAAFAGWWAGRVTADYEPEPARSAAVRTLELGRATVSVDGEWTAARRVPGLPAPAPRRAAAFMPVAGIAAYALVSFSAIDHPSLLPAGLRGVLDEPPRAPVRGVLLGRPAWRYPGLTIGGRRRTMDVTVLPTTAGALTVACIAPIEVADAITGCSSGVERVTLSGGARWVEPAGSLVRRGRGTAVVERLDRERVTARAALGRAKTGAAQARLAGRLAAIHRRAAAELGARRALASVASALDGAAAAYDTLAAAALAGDRNRYARAGKAVDRADAALGRSLAAAF